MKTVLILTFLLFVIVQLIAAPAAVQIRLGTLVPDGSIWHNGLRQMGAEWIRDTEGRVKLTIFPGGIQGNEPAMIRRLRFDQLQSAALTMTGLGDLDEAFNVLSIPFFFNSEEELLYVTEKLTPLLRQRLYDKGFYLLNWGYAGWVQLFSKNEVQTLSELQRIKIFTSAGDERTVQWYKSNGFNPVALSVSDILMGIQTGMIDAVPSPPLAALAFQWYSYTPHMLDVRLTPFGGATVITRKAWNSISEEDQKKIMAAAARLEKHLQTEVPKQEKVAIAEMQKRGLKITQLKGDELKRLQSTAERFVATLRGSIPADVFELAVRERNTFRQHDVKPASGNR